MNTRSLFVVFEGIDGSGKGTQIGEVERTIRGWNKYQDIVLTREPTWRAEEIRKRLETETDPLANGARMAELYIGDCGEHWKEIRSDLERKRVVLCDRYAMSTLAYQSTQGRTMFDLVSAHFTVNVGTPDMTFYLSLSPEEAAQRMAARGEAREKFENINFAIKLAGQYDFLFQESQKDGGISKLLGHVVKIDAAQESKFVTVNITKHLEPVYRAILSNSNGSPEKFYMPLG